MSIQALILAVLYIIIIVVALITSIAKHTFTISTFLNSIVSIGICALIVYDTNCLTSGGCTPWSWIRTTLYALLPIVALLGFVYSLFQAKHPAPVMTPLSPFPRVFTPPSISTSTSTTSETM